MAAKVGVLWVGEPSIDMDQAYPKSEIEFFHTQNFRKAKDILKTKSAIIKVILSQDIRNFSALKKEFPDPVRVLLIDHLDVTGLEEAINQGEIYRFVQHIHSEREIDEAIHEAARHYDLVSQHKYLLRNLKTQNRKLERVILRLEAQVQAKSTSLQFVDAELTKTKRYLEQLNSLIAWLNAAPSIEELQSRVEKSLKGILPVEHVILLETTTEDVVREVKKRGLPSIVMPLVYQKKCLGHLYFLCKSEKEIMELYDRVSLIKQVTDTVALTIEKIHIFNLSSQRKAEWEKTFDAIIDPVALINRNYEVVRANLSYSKITNLKLQELSGKKCYEVFQKRRSPCDGCLLQNSLLKKQPKNFDLRSSAQDTIYATSVFPLEPKEEGLSVLYYRDLGEERRLRDQLIQSEKMAEIGILAGSVAHEINNPLGGILAYIQILLSEVEKNSTLSQDLKEMEGAALRAKSIVENLLYFSRLSKEEDRRPVDLVSVLDKAISLASIKLKYQNVTIEKEIPNLKFLVMGDSNQLVQVFLNILQNSIQALLSISTQTVPGKIKIVLEKDETHVKVSLIDNGPGMDTESIKKLFHPFFTTKDKKEHLGLGLAVGYQIIKNHGGSINIQSPVDGGVLVQVILPLVAPFQKLKVQV